MRYEEAMKYITEVGNFGSNYGLERTHKLLEYLGNPEKDLKLIHIAGTNGKGSTTSMITEILIGAGYKVGMYTSPFIEEFEERIQINRNNIPKETLADLMDEVKEAVDKVIKGGYNHPTEFEIITVLMLLYFKKENIDFGVIEVGLGGRLDSTNVIKPILQVITSISFDHTNLLGNTLAEIYLDKACRNTNGKLSRVECYLGKGGKWIKVSDTTEFIYLPSSSIDKYSIAISSNWAKSGGTLPTYSVTNYTTYIQYYTLAGSDTGKNSMYLKNPIDLTGVNYVKVKIATGYKNNNTL